MYSVDVQKSSYKSGQSRINDGSRFISWGPWVRCLRLQSRVVHTVTAYITEKGLAESSAKLMGKGTTLIALVGATIGKVACW